MKRVEIVLTVLLILIAGGAVVFVAGSLISGNTGDDSDSLSYEKYFDPQKVTKVDIFIDDAFFNRMIATAPDRYCPCTIRLNGDVYRNVGIKVKGNSSKSHVLHSPTSNRHGFKIKADAYTRQSIAGLDYLLLNSDLMDATMMREYLSYDIMKKAGVKVPLFSYATVYVNGEYWGFYLIAEGVNQSFLKRNYGKDVRGTLYRPEGTIGITFPDGYGPDLSMNHRGGHLEYVGDDIYLYDEIFKNQITTLDSGDNRSTMLDIIRHINSDESPDDYLDVDEIIAYVAANVAISNLDSYFNQASTHNYYIFESGGKVAIIPWDCDIGFAPAFLSPSEAVNLPIDTPVQVIRGTASFDRLPLVEKVIKNPVYHEKYLSKLRTIAEEYMGDNLIERIDAMVPYILPYMEADPNVSFPVDGYFDNAVANLKKFVKLRTESLLGQLNGEIPTTYQEQQQHPELLVDPGDLNLVAIGHSKIWKPLWSEGTEAKS